MLYLCITSWPDNISSFPKGEVEKFWLQKTFSQDNTNFPEKMF